MAKGLKISEASIASQLNNTDRIPMSQGDGEPVTTTVGSLGEHVKNTLSEGFVEQVKNEAEDVMADILACQNEKINAYGTKDSDYKLVENITLTQDVVNFQRTEEPDGTVYNFKGIVVIATPPSNSVGPTYIYIYRDTNMLRAYASQRNAGDKIIGQSERVGAGICSWETEVLTLDGYIGNTYRATVPCDKNVTKLVVGSMKSGTNIKIYARK